MVFFFTGTGNSLYVAKRLSDNPLSIPQAIHDEKKVYQDETIGIVCPIYGHELPKLVKQFILESSFHASYFFVVLTYGKIHGPAARLCTEFLESCKIHPNYVNAIRMVDNYLPVFDMEKERRKECKKEIENRLSEIMTDIKLKKEFHMKTTRLDEMIHQRYLDMLRKNPLPVEKGLFYIDENCIGCGICSKVCPMGILNVINHHACFLSSKDCQMCLSCIHHCPEKAIHMKIREKNEKARYSNENIRLSEIVSANDQTGYGRENGNEKEKQVC